MAFALLASVLCGTLAPPALARDDSQLISKVDRKAILNELRAAGADHDRVFVVKYLAVENDWVWIRVDPQSRDNTNHYETESHLLHKAESGWQNVDMACGEEDCVWANEITRIQTAQPEAPTGIFEVQP